MKIYGGKMQIAEFDIEKFIAETKYPTDEKGRFCTREKFGELMRRLDRERTIRSACIRELFNLN